jgi:hypothetical protein
MPPRVVRCLSRCGADRISGGRLRFSGRNQPSWARPSPRTTDSLGRRRAGRPKTGGCHRWQLTAASPLPASQRRARPFRRAWRTGYLLRLSGREGRALRRHGSCPMQAKTAVSWHVSPPSEAKTAVTVHVCPPSEAKSVVEEGHGPMKEENLVLMSCKPVAFEQNRA